MQMTIHEAQEENYTHHSSFAEKDTQQHVIAGLFLPHHSSIIMVV
jgi:hypothetical protein